MTDADRLSSPRIDQPSGWLSRMSRWEPWARTSSAPPLAALALWARQCAMLLRAGMTLAEALDTLRQQPESASLERMLTRIYHAVLCGAQLSAALAEHPRAFPRHVCGAVRAGEQSGHLPDTLERLAGLYERDLELRRQLHQATVYPLLAGTLTISLCLVIMLFEVPLFRSFFADFSGGEAQLPLYTRLVLAWTGWLVGHWPWLLLAPLIIAGLRLVRNLPAVKARLDPLLLRLPLFGLLARKADSARCARCLAVLFASGVEVDEALELAVGTTVNHAVQQSLRRVLAKASAGQSLAQALKHEPVFAPLLASAVAVALDAAGAAENLNRLAELYEADIQRTLRVLLRQLEPALMILVGLWTGGVAVAMYLPIFNLVDVIK